ncbi:oxidoreductase [Streptomyces coelicoflavus]|uniref:oxidoreductase n=1 Tax=Streptomyces coelicoflavus TaxID=285562 RepID=UPI0036A86084
MPTLSTSSQIPDQTGRTFVITGAAGGIGKAAASALAARGARVILAVRDQAMGRAAVRDIGGRAEARALDLASLASIREFADGLREPVDVLVNNAGAMTAARQETRDGFESQFGVHHLGHFALTNLLLDRVTGRVVTISSSAHRSARIDFEDLQWERRPYRPFGAYGQSKLANLLFTSALQRRLTEAGSPVIATAAHPGWASTGFRITSGNRLFDTLMAIGTPLLAHGPEGGALPTLLASTGEVPAGSFAGPSRFGGVRGPATLAEPSPRANDPETAGRLWEVSERLTGTGFPLAANAPAGPREP